MIRRSAICENDTEINLTYKKSVPEQLGDLCIMTLLVKVVPMRQRGGCADRQRLDCILSLRSH